MILLAIQDFLGLTSGPIGALIGSYGYLAIFLLLILEAASLPIPSEVVLPLVGYLVYAGKLDFATSFAVVILGGVVGMGVDYYIAYFLKKDVVYKHLRFFHIRRESVEEFDEWFKKNGDFTVFITRLLPLVRGLINFPAGFAKMDLKKFFFYSITGTAIWDILLVAFGYYALSVSSLSMFIALASAFVIVIYLVYRIVMSRMMRK